MASSEPTDSDPSNQIPPKHAMGSLHCQLEHFRTHGFFDLVDVEILTTKAVDNLSFCEYKFDDWTCLQIFRLYLFGRFLYEDLQTPVICGQFMLAFIWTE